LIYAGGEIENLIKAKYPEAIIEDASDYIHHERFGVVIPNIDEDEFYPFAIKEGFARVCFSFAICLESIGFPKTKSIRPQENKAKIERWIELSKTLS